MTQKGVDKSSGMCHRFPVDRNSYMGSQTVSLDLNLSNLEMSNSSCAVVILTAVVKQNVKVHGPLVHFQEMSVTVADINRTSPFYLV